MMAGAQSSRKVAPGAMRAAVFAGLVVPLATTAQQRPAAGSAKSATYWVYAGAESADIIHRIRFSGDSVVVEKTIPIGSLPTEVEGPHGLAISSDGQYLYVTTAHGEPNGRHWRYALGPDTLIDDTFLGRFPASIDVTLDGLYTISANLNLYGGMVPSSLSVVYTRTNTEVAQIATCIMPHGSRVTPDGLRHYSACMMDDQLVEVDTRAFAVSRRFTLARGKEGPLAAESGGHGHDSVPHQMSPATCSPTWAQPSADGKTIFVACNKADEIVEIDRERWTISRRLKTGRGPYNLAVTPDGKLLVATLKQGAQTEIFELASGRSLARLPTSTTIAHGVAVSPDSRYAFVTSEGVGAAPGKVDVYDLQARVAVGAADLGQQASGIAFWKMEPAAR